MHISKAPVGTSTLDRAGLKQNTQRLGLAIQEPLMLHVHDLKATADTPMALASGVPPCGSDVLRVVRGAYAEACFDQIPRQYTLTQFCAVQQCQTFLSALTDVVETDCTVNGDNIKTFINSAQGCRSPTTTTTKPITSFDEGAAVTPVAGIPLCGPEVKQVVSGASAAACFDAIPIDYTDNEFCAVASCRTFLAALGKTVKSDCIFNGTNAKAFVNHMQGCQSTTRAPAATQVPSVPECGVDVRQVLNGATAMACFNAIPRDYTFSQFCTVSDCRSLLTALTKVVTTKCVVNGEDIQAFVENTQGCASAPGPVGSSPNVTASRGDADKSTLAPSSLPPATGATSDSKGGSSSTTIVLVITGCALVVALVGAVLFLAMRKRKQRKNHRRRHRHHDQVDEPAHVDPGYAALADAERTEERTVLPSGREHDGVPTSLTFTATMPTNVQTSP